MATINNTGGTSLNLFSINGGATIYQGSTQPSDNMGNNGDVYFLTNNKGDLLIKQNGSWKSPISSLPSSIKYENKSLYLPDNPYDSDSFDSSIVATIGWVNDPEKSLNVVHRTGNEKINGNKSFLKVPRINSNGNYASIIALENSIVDKVNGIDNVQQSENGSSNLTPIKRVFWTLCAVDKNKFMNGGDFDNTHHDGINLNKLGQFQILYNNSDDLTATTSTTNNPTWIKTAAQMTVYKASTGETHGDITIGYDNNNQLFSKCDAIPSLDHSSCKQIATTGWIHDNYLRKHGYFGNISNFDKRDNIIVSDNSDGNINFPLSFQQTQVTKGVTPPNGKFCAIDFYGKNIRHYYDRLGMIEWAYSVDSSSPYTSAYLYTYDSQYDYTSYLKSDGTIDDNKSSQLYKEGVAYSRLGIYHKQNKGYATFAPTPNDNIDLTNQIATCGWVQKSGSNRKLGEIIFSPVPFKDTTGLKLLNGDMIREADYPEFFKLISGNSYSNIRVTTTATTSTITRDKSNCGKFYINWDKRLIWLPDYRNIMTLNPGAKPSTTGAYLKPGLPNISGNLFSMSDWVRAGSTDNLFQMTKTGRTRGIGGGDNTEDWYQYKFDASKSNTIYSASTTVQPESVKILAYIVVSTSIKGDLGTTDINNLITNINTYRNEVTNMANSMITITSSGISGKNWWRKWSDGWLEQGGEIIVDSGWKQFSLIKNFANTNYFITGTCANNVKNQFTDNYTNIGAYVAIMNLTTSKFRCWTGDDATFNNAYVRWYACGQSA